MLTMVNICLWRTSTTDLAVAVLSVNGLIFTRAAWISLKNMQARVSGRRF
jgi:hypothetical protein